MSNFKPIVLALLIVTGFALPSRAEQSYVLTCRGGAGMLAIADQRVSNPHIFVEITYKRASQGAGSQAPAPGKCAWMDRPVSKSEPTVLHLDKANLPAPT